MLPQLLDQLQQQHATPLDVAAWVAGRYSEPEFLIKCMDRHRGWAFIVCLVGGGQEIGSGEAGIGSWIDACASRFQQWTLCVSDRLVDAEYDAGDPIRRAAALVVPSVTVCWRLRRRCGSSRMRST
jgi:hypothetical protein